MKLEMLKRPLKSICNKAKLLRKTVKRPLLTTKPTASKPVGDVFVRESVEQVSNTVEQVVNKGRIPAKVFKKDKGSPNIFDSFDFFPHLEVRRYDARFSDAINPVTLPRSTSKPFRTLINISNHNYPSGSIAVSSKLNEALYTSGLLQCAAISVVDRAHNVQSLFHCFPGLSAKDNRKILEYILKRSNPKDLEISIVPGCYLDSGKTVSFLKQTVDELAPEATVRFCNFPEKGFGLMLYKGNLTCAEISGLSNVVTNPMDRIIYID